MKFNFKEKLKKLFKFLCPQDVKCVFCGEEIKVPNKYICEDCLKKLPYNNGQICKLCGVQINSLADICESCFSQFFQTSKLQERPLFTQAKFALQSTDSSLITPNISLNRLGVF